MIKSSVARRYALALFDLAREGDVVDQVGAELVAFAGAVNEDRRLGALFYGRAFSPRQKNGLISRAVGGKLSPLAAQFIALLVDKQREDYIGGITTEYRKYVDRYRNVEEVTATTAVPLSEMEAQELAAKLSGAIKKQVRLVRTVDPKLLGGLVLKIGDRRVDASIRGRLNRLKERLAASAGDLPGGSAGPNPGPTQN